MIATNALRVIRSEAILSRRVLGRIVIGSLAYYVAVLALLHWLRPDVDPIARVTSEYAVGPYGYLMVSTFLVLSLALVALAMGLARSLAAPARSWPWVALLILAGLALAVAALFPVDVGAVRPITPSGWVHRIAAIVVFPSLSTGVLLLSAQFKAHRQWRDLAWFGTLVGLAGLMLFAGILLFFLERGLAGAAQRVFLALVIAWMVLVASRMMSLPLSHAGDISASAD